MASKLTQEKLKAILDYDPKTGEWRWLVRKSGRALVGDIAGGINANGYRGIRIDGVMYLSGPLAVFYMTGSWPSDQVDHRNRIRDDDRWDNLREATNGQNTMNQKTRSDSTSGHRGVYPYGQRFRSKIVVEGKQIYLGLFDTKEEAAEAYATAASKYFGEFAAV